jgi:hypothetical protein
MLNLAATFLSLLEFFNKIALQTQLVMQSSLIIRWLEFVLWGIIKNKEDKSFTSKRILIPLINSYNNATFVCKVNNFQTQKIVILTNLKIKERPALIRVKKMPTNNIWTQGPCGR